MDEAQVTPKSLLNYREIPVVRGLDRREVIEYCFAAVSLHLEIFLLSVKLEPVASSLWCALFTVSCQPSFSLLRFTLQFHYCLLSLLYLFFFFSMSNMASFGVGIKMEKQISTIGNSRCWCIVFWGSQITQVNLCVRWFGFLEWASGWQFMTV